MSIEHLSREGSSRVLATATRHVGDVALAEEAARAPRAAAGLAGAGGAAGR